MDNDVELLTCQLIRLRNLVQGTVDPMERRILDDIIAELEAKLRRLKRCDPL